jgi:tetratricopeptide (TPR) repeat protein
MRFIIHIVFVFFCFTSLSQEWRDSLDVARAAYKSKDYTKAMRYYESAQKKAPESINLSDEIAQSAYKAREFEKAEKVYQQNSTNKTSDIEKAENYHNLGNSKMKQKDFQGAIDSYKESLRRNPSDDNTRYNLSEAMRQLKDQQKNDQNSQQDQQDQQSKQNEQNNQNQNKNNTQNNEDQNSGGQLKNKTVDRMLDKLMKQEAETKRKVTGSNGENNHPQSGKDW